MSWINFMTVLLGIYILYYGLNFLLDYLHGAAEKNSGEDNRQQLWVEDIEPVIVQESDFAVSVSHSEPAGETSVASGIPPLSEAGVQPRQQEASGGVSIAELVRLYRHQAIVCSARHEFAST